MNEDERLHGQKHIATVLNNSPKTLESWRHKGIGPPYICVGRLVRYRMKDVMAWLESRRVNSTSQVAR